MNYDWLLWVVAFCTIFVICNALFNNILGVYMIIYNKCNDAIIKTNTTRNQVHIRCYYGSSNEKWIYINWVID